MNSNPHTILIHPHEFLAITANAIQILLNIIPIGNIFFGYVSQISRKKFLTLLRAHSPSCPCHECVCSLGQLLRAKESIFNFTFTCVPAPKEEERPAGISLRWVAQNRCENTDDFNAQIGCDEQFQILFFLLFLSR